MRGSPVPPVQCCAPQPYELGVLEEYEVRDPRSEQGKYRNSATSSIDLNRGKWIIQRGNLSFPTTISKVSVQQKPCRPISIEFFRRSSHGIEAPLTRWPMTWFRLQSTAHRLISLRDSSISTLTSETHSQCITQLAKHCDPPFFRSPITFIRGLCTIFKTNTASGFLLYHAYWSCANISSIPCNACYHYPFDFDVPEY